jgi:hypothetical protein
MVTHKVNTLIEKHNLHNIIKLVLFLVVLFLIYRIFTINTDTIIDSNIVEGFGSWVPPTSPYGNEIVLSNPINEPEYNNNKCYFEFDGLYRIDSLVIKFNNNPVEPINLNGRSQVNPYNGQSIFIEYEDENGNIKKIKPQNSTTYDMVTDTSTTYNSSEKKITLNKIIDENNLVVYTSKIILTVGGVTNIMSNYTDSNNKKYITEFGFFGGSKDLITKSDLNNTSSNLEFRPISRTNPQFKNDNDIYTFSQSEDKLVYGIKFDRSLYYGQSGSDWKGDTGKYSSESPINISISYNNTIYPSKEFNINSKFYVRCDIYKLSTSNTIFVLFDKPVIANKFMITCNRTKLINNFNEPDVYIVLQMDNLNLYCNTPTTSDISNFKRNINLLNQQDSNLNTNICPSINNIMSKQSTTQQICDNLEYQDKIKSEKLRLERNKQYLLKLKDQQEQIDQLNMIINDLDKKRQSRIQIADKSRLLQYQKQKTDVSTVRDLANQRLDSQSNNELYMDININTT